MLLSFLLEHAQAASNTITPVGSPNPTSGINVGNAISSASGKVITILFMVGGALAVIYLLWSGVQYISAGGDQEKAKKARQGIINAVIGIIVMMATYAIVRLSVTFGTEIAGWF